MFQLLHNHLSDWQLGSVPAYTNAQTHKQTAYIFTQKKKKIQNFT